MDAQAHLLSLGWAGPGNALNAHKAHKGRGGLGLTKPLLVSQKKNNFGIGKKQHEPANEWWLKGFEAALKGVGQNGDSYKVSAVSSATVTPPLPSSGYAGKHTGLYGFFTRGQVLQGTIHDADEDQSERKSKKRKSDCIKTDSDTDESGLQFENVKESTQKTSKKSRPSQDFREIGQFMAVKEKDRKRNKREARPDAVTQFEQMGAFFASRSESRTKKGLQPDIESTLLAEEGASSPESKMARKERRRAEKAARKLAKSMKERKENGWTHLVGQTDAAQVVPGQDATSSSHEEVERQKGKASTKRRRTGKEVLRAQQEEAPAETEDIFKKKSSSRKKH